MSTPLIHSAAEVESKTFHLKFSKVTDSNTTSTKNVAVVFIGDHGTAVFARTLDEQTTNDLMDYCSTHYDHVRDCSSDPIATFQFEDRVNGEILNLLVTVIENQ